MTSATLTETAAEFLTERADYLHIHVVRSVNGQGWDVVMRIDGTYFDFPGDTTGKEMAEAVAADMRRTLRWSDVPRDRMEWWDGPPWQARR